jgi:hypothetical protein
MIAVWPAISLIPGEMAAPFYLTTTVKTKRRTELSI